MTAPALVCLAHGSRDPRSAETITALVDEVRALRPDLRIETAFLEFSKPSFNAVVGKLARAGVEEIVVVPLLLTEAYHAKVDVPAAIAEQSAKHEGLKIRASSILGLENAFLEVLDLRLRAALKEARVLELDALVLAAAGSSDQLANRTVARLARVWGAHHHLPVKAAFASTAPRQPARPCVPSGPRAVVTSPSDRSSLRRASCPTVPLSLPSRPAPLRSPRRWAPTRSWPASYSPGMPSAPSSSSPSDPRERPHLSRRGRSTVAPAWPRDRR